VHRDAVTSLNDAARSGEGLPVEEGQDERGEWQKAFAGARRMLVEPTLTAYSFGAVESGQKQFVHLHNEVTWFLAVWCG
jgi:hypothetical protein